MIQDITMDVFWQSVRNVQRKTDNLEKKLTHMDGIMIDPVEFGQLKAEVAAQRRDLDRLATTLEHIAKAMDDVRDTLTEARGGWRAVAMIGGIAGTLGAAVAWMVQHVKISP
jgi:uncharacterized coiled-coil protein SlyX